MHVCALQTAAVQPPNCDHGAQETFDSAVEENIAEFDMEVRHTSVSSCNGCTAVNLTLRSPTATDEKRRLAGD